jgi:hypothetical protein
MKKIASILLTMLAFVQVSSAQDVIQLMNGKEKKVIYDSQVADNVYYFKKEGGRKHKLDREDVFRVFKKNGDTVYVYVQDTLLENEYTVNEIERMINGQKEARKYYKPYWNMAGGFCAGGVGAFLGFWSFIPPAVYATIIGIREANSANFVVSDDNLYDDEFFLEGYEIGARAKKIKYALIGSLAGIATGVSILYIIIPAQTTYK